MPKADQNALRDALADVAREPNGPKVVFPFGFKIIELDGEKVLCPMTSDEYNDCLVSDGIDARAKTTGGCYITTGNRCVSQGCTGGCDLRYQGGFGAGWYCVCV